ncbi:MAG TPA: choice-of-anchor Q domain-containing protein, partial [Rudaea sp.]|nr:choice-of-anchor Q domain-containing protein [Rudaea sp.]
ILYLDQSTVIDNYGQYGSGISNAGTLHVSASAINGNYGYTLGGGIYNTGTVDIHNTIVSGNGNKLSINGNQGGGIFNAGQLAMDTSTVSGNASSYGGGIHNSGSLQLDADTIDNNISVQGGGIDNSKTLFVSDSTISGNSATFGNGGGIANSSATGNANIYNSTITLNVAGVTDAGGGVYNDSVGGALFALRNTLIANNYAPSVGQSNDCAGILSTYGKDLVGTISGLPANCTVATPVGVSGSWTYLNPSNSLGPLQNNGGPTSTHALLPGSNAIDGGDAAPPGCVDQDGPILTDQRGLPRSSGAACDIGAFEYVDRIFKNGYE